MDAEHNKLLVRWLVEGINNGSLEVLDEVADGRFARAARQWIGPFRDSFPDFRMEIIDLIADDEKGRRAFPVRGHPPGPVAGTPAVWPAFLRCR